MTNAEAIAVGTRRVHGACVVSTRHFAAPRGASRAGRLLAPWIAAGLAREIAVGNYAARNLERVPAATLLSGVRPSPCLWRVTSRVVLVLQRLDREKHTFTAVRAWQASGMAEDGWELRIVGDGDERESLERYVASQAIPRVTFSGWTNNVPEELARAGMLIATRPDEPLGLGVLEAMAAGVPVVACGSGGHLETIGLVPCAPLFAPDDAGAAAAALRSLLADSLRQHLSAGGRRVVAERFTVERHVDRLISEYEAACSGSPRSKSCRAPSAKL